ncbi:DedA family protein [Sphingomonas flavalba]|uniref:DedA family protein n=1 Tax=Sphingomonas flavalba TaxID=2559804 RepID=UPI0039E1413A
MTDWVIRLIEEAGYLGVALLMFLETVFPPIPSEVIMSVAGVGAARGYMSLWGVIVSGTIGAMAGNYVWYVLARAIGIARFRPLIDRFGRWLTIDWREIERGEALFERFGAPLILFGRMLPTVRSLISIPAGLLGMKTAPFLLWSTIGTAGWTAMLAIAGYVLGKRFADIEAVLGPLSSAVIVAVLAVYVWRVLFWRPER